MLYAVVPVPEIESAVLGVKGWSSADLTKSPYVHDLLEKCRAYIFDAYPYGCKLRTCSCLSSTERHLM